MSSIPVFGVSAPVLPQGGEQDLVQGALYLFKRIDDPEFVFDQLVSSEYNMLQLASKAAERINEL
ncbi:MAG TPA: hypothetical protein ENH02_08000 [Bacteroidetes bacterium]|nr:hypothetical protein [Bacteroidota bacterium]